MLFQRERVPTSRPIWTTPFTASLAELGANPFSIETFFVLYLFFNFCSLFHDVPPYPCVCARVHSGAMQRDTGYRSIKFADEKFSIFRQLGFVNLPRKRGEERLKKKNKAVSMMRQNERFPRVNSDTKAGELGTHGSAGHTGERGSIYKSVAKP